MANHPDQVNEAATQRAGLGHYAACMQILQAIGVGRIPGAIGERSKRCREVSLASSMCAFGVAR